MTARWREIDRHLSPRTISKLGMQWTIWAIQFSNSVRRHPEFDRIVVDRNEFTMTRRIGT